MNEDGMQCGDVYNMLVEKRQGKRLTFISEESSGYNTVSPDLVLKHRISIPLHLNFIYDSNL
jgi:hypothetical protein